MENIKKYNKIFYLLILFILIFAFTLIIKYYFTPFLSMIVIYFLSKPCYKIFLRFKIGEKVSGALSIFLLNIILIITILYLGNSIYFCIQKIIKNNIDEIKNFYLYISSIFGVDNNINEKLLSVINLNHIKTGAILTGEGLLSYCIGNICSYFLLVDKDKLIDLLNRLFPDSFLDNFFKQKNNIRKVIVIECILVLISTVEIIIGFIILGIEKPMLFGIICGILDILPYVGTIIVFIPFIIYNIILKDYIVAFGLCVLYILVQLIREILEAKFLGESLQLHPLIIFLSIYLGIKIVGFIGVLTGPLYVILAKELIYNKS